MPGVSEAIAVVGIACRLPGAGNPAEFADLLARGGDAVTEVPADRRDVLSGAPGVPSRGGFLRAVDRFDAAFFGLSPREAAAMDPQQRLLLELGWEALEHAGIIPAGLLGSRTGVFAGTLADDYAALVRAGGPEAVTPHTFTGVQRSLLANRVSYTLGLRGPSLTVDTGQSSSLVSVHLAVESLRRGECTLALAGGVNLILSADSTRAVARIGALSPDGRCHTFDARANGYVRGEGGGLVVLKPLSAALADGDTIHCLIRGSAVNNDGGGSGLTVPDPEAQREVLLLACERAATDPAAVQYVELHGTGTPEGDPAEAAALGAALGAARPGGALLRVGSVKTNIGHLEGAAGIAGLIKAVLCLRDGQLVPTLHHDAPHPRIPLDELRLTVQRTAEPWPDGTGPRVAGVSAFGLGGTNCHVVLSSWDGPESTASGEGGEPQDVSSSPWILSARTREALAEQARRLRDALHDQPGVTPADVGHALLTTRTRFAHRGVVLGADLPSRLRGLATLADGGSSPAVVTTPGPDAPPAGPGAVFVFPGQGSQWAGMAVGLLDGDRAFAARWRECEEALGDCVDWSPTEVLRAVADAPDLDRVEVLQPVLWAVMVSLAEAWRSYGVEPAAVVGHSQGEVAAACVAGVLSLADGARIAVRRAELIGRNLSGYGGMVAVPESEPVVRARLAALDGRVEIAAVNGPDSVVVAGSPDALEELLASCGAQDVRARRVAVDYASHSSHVEAVREELLDALDGITPRQARVPLHSTVEPGVTNPLLDGAYWYRNLRETVAFEPAVTALAEAGHRVFIEISPHPVLTTAVSAIVERTGAEPVVVPTLRRHHGGPEQLTHSLAQAFVGGTDVDWTAAYAGHRPGRRVELPTYPFQRRRHWLTAEGPAAAAAEADPVAPPASTGPTGPADQAAQRPEAPASAPAPAPVPSARRAPADLLGLVRTEAAAVLGHEGAADIAPGLTFKDLGFDSHLALELRGRLSAATGRRLPTTVLFEHPTPAALARHLNGDEAGQDRTAPTAAQAATEPIAIIGMACRLPGGITGPEDLWQAVRDGADAIGPPPADRGWDDTDHRGGFLADAASFDADLFGIAPREALAMDPQQRLLLETAWEAAERAGIAPSALRGTRTGVYVGAMSQDYGPRLHEASDDLRGYLLTGNTAGVLSGRLSYVFGCEGPAVTVDTACSSSLVALHLAVESLRRGECSMAFAAGVAAMATPGLFSEFAQQNGLSADGRCKAFAAAADGTGWAEGVGVLLVERLSDARRSGHRVLAVVRGSAINQDGASNGLTAPSGPAQQRVIRDALANAGLSPADVDAVEAHGTGTRLGDPIEAQALIAAYGQDRPGDRPLWLGSLKSNIGHAQAAAGVAGVIKTVMAMRHHAHPRTLHVDEPSPHVDWSTGAVRLLTEAREWATEAGRPRRAGVSSFGISGTNAHVVLEEGEDAGAKRGAGGGGLEGAAGERSSAGGAPDAGTFADLKIPVDFSDALPVPLVLSAATEDALRAQAQRLRARLTGGLPRAGLGGIGHALAVTRSALPHRAAVVTADREEALAGLGALAAGAETPHTFRDTAGDGRTAFLFTGQGSQRPRMGLGLYAAQPVFRAALDEIAGHLDAHLEHPLLKVLAHEPELLDRTEYAQPALFALQVALFRLLEHWGLAPDHLFGHSVGELAAVHAAGVLSLSDACALVAARGRLMQALPGGGAMAALAVTEQEILPDLAGREHLLGLAAVNGPAAVVISGDRDAVEEIAGIWAGRGRRTRMLRVSHAFHSPHMDPALTEFERVARTVTFHDPALCVVSGLTGEPAAGDDQRSAGYWVRHARHTVRFHDGIRRLRALGATGYVELGPDGVLSAMAQECLADGGGRIPPVLVPLLRKDRPEPSAAVAAVARLHLAGHSPHWPSVFSGHGPADPDDLPTYAFRRRRYWASPEPSGSAGAPGATTLDHPVLAAAVGLAGAGHTLLTGRVSLSTHPWLADRTVAGTAVVPDAVLLDLALTAARETDAGQVTELRPDVPLVLPEHGALAVQVLVGPEDPRAGDGARPMSVHSRPDGGDGPWTRHATGLLGPRTAATAEGPGPGQWPPEDATEVDGSETALFYDRASAAGTVYGPAFPGPVRVWRRDTRPHGADAVELLAEIEVSDAGGFALHPGLLEGVLHTLLMAAPPPGGDHRAVAYAEAVLHTAGVSRVRARITRRDDGTATVGLTDPAGRPVATIGALTPRALPETVPSADGGSAGTAYELAWRPVGTPPGVFDGGWALVGDLALPDHAVPGAARFADLDALAAGVVPEVVVIGCATGPDPAVVDPAAVDPAGRARAAAHRAARIVREWLADDRFADARLVVLTRRAVPVDGDDCDPAEAPVWGLLRVAQTEHPGRFLLVDLDDDRASAEALPSAVAGSEPQLALRGGLAHAPRIVRPRTGGQVTAAAPAAAVPAFDPDGTVLVTGGTGALGRLVARRLVTRHGARNLLLVSRQGSNAPEAAAIAAELGARPDVRVTVAACDTADRATLTRLLAAVPEDHPLTAVVHTAGVVRDAVTEAIDPRELDEVLHPKVTAAWLLHELTAGLGLSAFVLFSSVSGILGAAGQGGYAAGNTFLDALASERRAQGLPAVSLAWGPWGPSGGMTSALTDTDFRRMARTGLRPLTEEQGLTLFDAALSSPGPALLLPMALSRPAIRRAAQAGRASFLLRELAGASWRDPAVTAAAPQGPADTGTRDAPLRRLLSGRAPREQEALLLEQVRAHAAAVLGHRGSSGIDAARTFKELGFDSLMGVELRNRLSAAGGRRMPAGLLFNHPTPLAVARYLGTGVGAGATTTASLDEELGKLEALLTEAPADRAAAERAAGRLRALLARCEGAAGAHGTNGTGSGGDSRGAEADDGVRAALRSATADEIFSFIDNEFGAR
ncbi:SDR family NAD(P)-dependent oxidoreductase [Streptomyces sp. NPDC046862]|uniref:type I polyketide synthase n=1 Tax=Streptomyces sp. NPDC046862 TaxID=3154603 RepID=UPI00345311B7